jgi:hypothetical protein
MNDARDSSGHLDLPVLEEIGEALFSAFAAADRVPPRRQRRWHISFGRRMFLIGAAIVAIAPATYATHIFTDQPVKTTGAKTLAAFTVGAGDWRVEETPSAANACRARVLVLVLDGVAQLSPCTPVDAQLPAAYNSAWARTASYAYAIGAVSNRVVRVDVVGRPATLVPIAGTPDKVYVAQTPLSWFGDAPLTGYDARGHVVFNVAQPIPGNVNYSLFMRLLRERHAG